MRSELVVSGVADLVSARRFARRHLRKWGVADLDDTVALLVSETVTNALLHARTGAHVAICYDGVVVRVEVRDGSVALPVVKHYAEMAPSGRGLRLLDSLASSWGVISEETGKTVWFELLFGPGPGDGSGYDRRRLSSSSSSGGGDHPKAGPPSRFDELRVVLPALAS